MADLGYIAAGYGATAAALVWYRWWLAHRAVRARELTAALTGRRPRAGRGDR